MDKSSSLHPIFCYEWVTSATFHYMWTNSEAQTNQLSTKLDVYGCYLIHVNVIYTKIE